MGGVPHDAVTQTYSFYQKFPRHSSCKGRKQNCSAWCMLNGVSAVSKAQMHVEELPCRADEVLNADRARHLTLAPGCFPVHYQPYSLFQTLCLH